MAENNNKVEKVKNKKLVDVVNLKEVEVYISKENKVEKSTVRGICFICSFK